jgi:L-ascorbate metabolism protein UlaG (beta-lactamase superfamily)
MKMTSPTFIHQHEKVSLGYGLSSTRLTNPAMNIGELPPLDLVVLSHFHGDHFDQVAQQQLNKSIPIVTTHESATALKKLGFDRTMALNTWSSLVVNKAETVLRVTSLPGRHGPALVSKLLPAVMGSMLEFQTPSGTFHLYITGDTLVIDDLKDIPRIYPEIHLALLHLGGTRVLGVLVTMDAKQGLEMMQLVRPQTAIPIHFNDYDVFTSPLSDFRQEVTAAGLGDHVVYLKHGESHVFELSSNRAVAA